MAYLVLLTQEWKGPRGYTFLAQSVITTAANEVNFCEIVDSAIVLGVLLT